MKFLDPVIDTFFIAVIFLFVMPLAAIATYLTWGLVYVVIFKGGHP